jgi:hypothetical protein
MHHSLFVAVGGGVQLVVVFHDICFGFTDCAMPDILEALH